MADKSPVPDGTAGVEYDSPDDRNVGSKPDETKHPYLPEVPVTRRKMGSNRRIKGRQNLKGVDSKSYQMFGEEVKEVTESTALSETAQKVVRQRVVHVFDVNEDHSLITSGHQSRITSPDLKDGKGLEVDGSQDVLFHSLDEQLNVMSPNLREGESQSKEGDDTMQWLTEKEKSSSFKRSLKSTTKEELTDKSSPCERTDELISVDQSTCSSKALFNTSVSRDETENTLKENATSLDVEGQAECQDNFQNKEVKSVPDYSGNKRRLGSSRKNTRKRQVREEDDTENCYSGVNQPHSVVNTMFSPEVSKDSMTNILVSNLNGLNPQSGCVQDQHQIETNNEHERSDKSVETKIKGLDTSSELAEVPEKEVKPTQIQQTAKHDTFESVTDDGTDSNAFSSPLTDQTNKTEMNQISTCASAPDSHSLIKECVKHNSENTRLQDINLSEIECKNNNLQILPLESHKSINLQQQSCPSTESHPESVSKTNVEKPEKHFTGDESTVGTMSVLEQIERKSDDGRNIDIPSASCDGFVLLEKPGEVTLEIIDESEDGGKLQAVEMIKVSAKDANNGTSDINLKNMMNDEDKDSVEVKQDAHSGSHVEILTPPCIDQIIESSLTNDVDSADVECTYTTNTKCQTEEEEFPQIKDEHSNVSSSNIRETQHLDKTMYEVDMNEMPTGKMQHGKYIPDESDFKTSENVASVDSLESQSCKSGSDTGVKIGNRRKLGSSRRNKRTEKVNNSVTEKDDVLINAGKIQEVETTESEELNSGGQYRSPKKSLEEDREISDQSTQILGQLAGPDTFMDSMQSFQASVLTDNKSNMQGISFNNDGDNLDVTDQEQVCNAQSGTSSCNKHSPEKEVSLLSAKNIKETVELVTISCAQITKASKNDDGLYCEELNPSTHVVVSGTETTRAINEPEACKTSISNDSSNSIHQIKSDMMDDIIPYEKQRALGTTQKLQPNSKHNELMEKDEMLQSTLTVTNTYLPASAEETIPKTNEITSAQDMSSDVQCNSTDLQVIDRNLIPVINDLNSLLTEQSVFPRVEVVNLQPCNSKVANVKETERTDVSLHTSQLDSFTNTELQMISEENTCSVRRTDKNTQSVRRSSPITETLTSHNESETEENVKIDQINKVDEEAQRSTSEIADPSVTSTFMKRRKMGSNRKNPNFFSKREKMFPKEEENETKTTTGSEQKHLHRITVKHGEDQGKEVEHMLNTECETNEGNPSQQREGKDQLDAGYFPSPASESPTLSEQASVGRRRKLGSHRKSRQQNYNEDRSAITSHKEHQSHVRCDPDDGETMATDSDCPDNKPKDDESSKTRLSSFTLAKSGENTLITGKQTSVQSHKAGKGIQNKIPLTGKEVETSSNHYNVLMIGDSNVGKTSFIKRAHSGKFSLDVPSSVGLDFSKWTVMVDGKPVVLHVWDTAGQERFRSITRQVFHRAQAFLLMYDISSSQSFSAVTYWTNCIQDSGGENAIILLVGNKCDHAERQVRSEEGENLAKEYKFAFSECSAASGENVIECLETVARMLSQMPDSKRDAKPIHNEGTTKKRSTCC